MSIIPPLSTSDIAFFQQGIAAAHIETARAQAIGGATWSVLKPGAGDGVNAPIGGLVAAGTATLSAFYVEAADAAVVLPGVQVKVSHWEFRAAADQLAEDEDADGLWLGRTIQSVADASLRFRIATLDSHNGYLQGVLDEAGEAS